MTRNGSAIGGVYLVTDQEGHLPERVRKALQGGVSVVQYRRKGGEHGDRYALGAEVKAACTEFGVPFIVNDDVDLARQLDADGVHLVQDDGDPAAARLFLGDGKIIGVSTHDEYEARRAEAAGADYIGFGAMYPTGSKNVLHLPGPAALAAVRSAVAIPVVAIGGITQANAAAVIDAGADAVAVISAILSDRQPHVAAAELALAFNRPAPSPRGSVLSVAGSDSGGGAGIQADLKTITLMGSYAASVLTAVTAQNTCGVSGVHAIPATFVAEQLEAVLSDLPVDVVKTGMLYSAEITAVIADLLHKFRRYITVVDPVLLAKGGAPLLQQEALAQFRDLLLPRTYLLTPNIPEAEWLTGLKITDEAGMEEAARVIHGMGVRNVLIKGGHLAAESSTDILFDGSCFSRYSAPRIDSTDTHGTGCTYASAISALLAQGEPLSAAIGGAKRFITGAIRHARPMGKGQGPVNHFEAARDLRPVR